MVQYTLIEHQNPLSCIDRLKQILYHKYSNKKLNGIILLHRWQFIMEHNTSIIGSMKSIIGKNFGKFSIAFWENFWVYLTEAYLWIFQYQLNFSTGLRLPEASVVPYKHFTHSVSACDSTVHLTTHWSWAYTDTLCMWVNSNVFSTAHHSLNKRIQSPFGGTHCHQMTKHPTVETWTQYILCVQLTSLAGGLCNFHQWPRCQCVISGWTDGTRTISSNIQVVVCLQ